MTMETATRVDQMPLVGGTLVFDFLNTRGGSPGEPNGVGIRDYADLLAWASHAGALSGADAERLAVVAGTRAREARSVHARSLAQRAYLDELFDALHEGGRAPESALASLRDDESEAISHAELVGGSAGFEWSWAAADGLARPLWVVVHAATTLLTSGDLWRVKRCAGCAWWFLDETRNQSRRWCRMEDCGTAEKMRRYVARRAARREERR
jgi:predicted RNA-binding Zn ribbon-like protein